MIDHSFVFSRANRLQRRQSRWVSYMALATFVGLLSGCASLGASGPSSGDIKHAEQTGVGAAPIKVVDLNDQVARQIISANATQNFLDLLGHGTPVGTTLGAGDILDITIWEAPPAALFGASTTESRLVGVPTTPTLSGARNSSLPEQMVDQNGRILIPFVGAINVAGRSTRDVEREIVRSLAGKAHAPQAMVRVVRNATSNVTVIGDVANSVRVPLTPKGERLLDVLAAAGGSRQPVGKTTVQITRGKSVVTMPLVQVIENPTQNIILQPDDVVTALYQPYSFTALGAVGNNAEINFEGTGLTLAQALGRVGGARDDRADVRGVFIFRLEDPAALGTAAADAPRTPDGKVPVIYRVDLKNPASFFVAQGFPIRNRDVLYVSNAPIADFQKFVNIISSMAFSIVGVGNAL